MPRSSMSIGGAGFLKGKKGRYFTNKGKTVEMFYDSNRDPIIIKPGETKFLEMLERTDVGQFLIDPNLYNVQKEIEGLLENKPHLTILVDASLVGRFGDQVMLTIIPKAYKETLEERVTLDVLIPDNVKCVWEHNPYVREIITGDIAGINKNLYDKIINFNNLEMKWKERTADKTLGYRTRSSIILDNLGIHLINKTPVWVVTAEEKEAAKKFYGIKEGDVFVAIQERASCPAKYYPYMADVKNILTNEKIPFISLDSPDLPLAPIRVAAAAISLSGAVLALDSAFLHIAGALKKRIVGIFGYVDGKIFTEDYEKAVALQAPCELGKSPCWWSVDCLPGSTYAEKEQAGVAACLTKLSSDVVADAVKKALLPRPKILACMLTYNLLHMTKKAIASVRSKYDVDIFVADNESTDGTADWLTEKNIKFVSKKTPVSAACNLGIDEFLAGNYDYFLLLNNDIIVHKTAIEDLVDCLGKSNAWAATATETRDILPWMTDDYKERSEGWETIIDIPASAYSCTLFTRSCIEKVGKFDEQFAPRYIEDNDFTLRIRLAGGSFVKSKKAIFYHVLGGVLKTNSDEKLYSDVNWQKNIRRYFDKWGIYPHEPQDLTKIKPKDPAYKPAHTYVIKSTATGYGDHIFLSVVAKVAKKTEPNCKVYYCVPQKFFDVYKFNPYIDGLSKPGDKLPAGLTFDFTDYDYFEEEKEVSKYGQIKSTRSEIFLKACGLPTEDLQPTLIITDSEKTWAEKEWNSRLRAKSEKFDKIPRVVVARTASNKIMTWPKMDEFVSMLKQESACRVCVLDENRNGSFVYGFRQAAALTATADIYVGPNTGFSNVAGALNIPAITIFSYRNGEIMAKMYPSMTPIQGECSVAPGATFCDYKAPCIEGTNYRRKENVKNPDCINSISVKSIWYEMWRRLGREDVPQNVFETELRKTDSAAKLLKTYKIDPAFLANPGSYRLRDAFNFALKNKGSFSVLIIRDNSSYVTKAGLIGGRGDIMMASVIAKALRYHYGDKVKIYMKVMVGGESLIEHNPYVDKVFTDMKEAEAVNPDIQFSVNEFDFNVEMKDLAAGNNITANRTSIYLTMLGLPLIDKAPVYIVTDEEEKWAEQELIARGYDLSKPIIGIQRKGSNISRTWPHVDELIKNIETKYQTIVLDEMVDGLFRYSFPQSAALLKKTAVVVAPNSFFFHLAGAMKHRCITLFGSVDPKIWVEDYEKTTALSGTCPYYDKKCWWDLKCLSGHDRYARELSASPECLSMITTDDVIAEIDRQLNPKKVAIILLTYNCLESTKKTIDSLRSFHDYKIFVADNASTDGTVDWLTNRKISFVSRKMSCTEAQNTGFKMAREHGEYDYYMILNNDVILAPNYLDTLVSTMEEKKYAAITGKVIDSRETGIDGYLGKSEDKEHEMTAMIAGDFSAILLDKSILEKVGKTDEQFFPRYQEDEDYLLRIRLSGGKIIRTSRTVFYHYLGTTQANHPEERAKHDANWERNVSKFKKKWNFDPYAQRGMYEDITNIKINCPDWKTKILIPL